MPAWLTWVIIAIVVIAIIAAIAVAAAKKNKQRKRDRAGAIREDAAVAATGVQKREAHAAETEAEAAAARAEADRKQAEAQRLAAEAEERRRTADSEREQHDEQLLRADKLDPNVNTRSNDYTGPQSTGTVGDTSSGDSTTDGPADGSHRA